MDTGSTLIGTIMIMLIIVPFIIISYRKKRKKVSLLQSLNTYAQQFNCEISEHEFCGDFLLALDESKNFVFFLKYDKDDKTFQKADLSTIEKCKTIKRNHTASLKNRTDVLTEHIDLVFLPSKKNQAAINFELYDAEKNLQLGDEIQCADKWEKLLNKRLTVK